MRSIQDCCREGIRNVDELKEALQLAMQLEFATIPPYLCAQWSVRVDPDRVEGLLHHIVGQEMNHLALAGNLLTSIGGRPQIARADFLPCYPLAELPGGISQDLPIDLRPLTFDQVQVFMQIEQPGFPTAALGHESDHASIGDFYEAIIRAFEVLKPEFVPAPNQVPVAFSTPIDSVASAVSAVTRIMLEGEGSRCSPGQPTPDGMSLAHYYLFKEIYRQRRLVQTAQGWQFDGPRIQFPAVYDFKAGDCESAGNQRFRKTLTQLLKELDRCWRNGDDLNVATMFQLRAVGRDLIRNGLKPAFEWSE